MITFGDMAKALYQLRQKYGLYYNPSEQEIFRYAQNMHKPEVDSSQPLDVKQEGGNGVPPTLKSVGIPPKVL
jgi:hypothetical protein